MPMVSKKVRSALPVYIAAGAWLLCALLFPMYKLVWIIVAALVSAAAYIVARILCKDRTVSVYEPDKGVDTGDRELDGVLNAASRQLAALEAASCRISDERLSAEVTRMENAGRSILAEITRDHGKLPKARRFLSYYLPTAVKAVEGYVRIKTGGVGGKHSEDVIGGVEDSAGRIADAFEAQLDALYAGEALDITTDLEVLEKMMESDGLTR